MYTSKVDRSCQESTTRWTSLQTCRTLLNLSTRDSSNPWSSRVKCSIRRQISGLESLRLVLTKPPPLSTHQARASAPSETQSRKKKKCSRKKTKWRASHGWQLGLHDSCTSSTRKLLSKREETRGIRTLSLNMWTMESIAPETLFDSWMSSKMSCLKTVSVAMKKRESPLTLFSKRK